jgi:hypothetical protein
MRCNLTEKPAASVSYDSRPPRLRPMICCCFRAHGGGEQIADAVTNSQNAVVRHVAGIGSAHSLRGSLMTPPLADHHAVSAPRQTRPSVPLERRHQA